jgi:hypothetical protein
MVSVEHFEYTPRLFLFFFFNAMICAIWRARVNFLSSVSSSMSEEWSEAERSELLPSSSSWKFVGELEAKAVLSVLGRSVLAANSEPFLQ